MAYVSSTYKDPNDNFVWWIEGDRIAIATTKGDGDTTETTTGKLKAPQIGSTGDAIIDGIIISYYAEPDKLSSITGTIDLDNSLQPALINYVKGQALMDAAAREEDPNKAMIKSQAAQACMQQYQEEIRKFGMKKKDKVGGTREVVPPDLR
tara:strand:- start:54 stop:506 length:453 start_codon:yes stop_codon:yes gene_type:complete